MSFLTTLSFLFLIIYGVTIFSFALGWLKINPFTHPDLSAPLKVGVIVACRNEEKTIANLIQSLLQQDYPSNKTELIFIDDHSEDHTYKILKKYAKKNNQLTVHQNPGHRQGKKEAIAFGIQHCSSDIIITTDADCRMGEKWLSGLVNYYTRYRPKIIVAPVVLAPARSIFEKLQALEFTSLILSGAGAIGINKPILCNGANLLFEKSLFNPKEQHQQYASGDDIFLLLQAKKKDSRDIHFIKSRDAIVYTNPTQTLSAFFHQRIRWTSKSKAYRDFDLIITAVTVAASNLLLTFWLIHTIFFPNEWHIPVLLFTIKSLADLFILIPGTRYFHQSLLLWLFLPLQIIYPFYIVTTACMGWLANFSWKGRKLR
ncbi:MAG: glycosyltransferase [Bacteroidales bacterium]|jgi:cellulose synthase/poly-beta-1,6-N-acetylglucosamine synthase-like glycosyltransferase|nr:glycosyltransferase [Bacteroidales bacterium]